MAGVGKVGASDPRHIEAPTTSAQTQSICFDVSILRAGRALKCPNARTPAINTRRLGRAQIDWRSTGGRFAFSLGRRRASLWGGQFRLQIIGGLQAHALPEAHHTLKWPWLGKIKGLARNQATPSVSLYSEAALTKPGLIQRRIVPDTHTD